MNSQTTQMSLDKHLRGTTRVYVCLCASAHSTSIPASARVYICTRSRELSFSRLYAPKMRGAFNFSWHASSPRRFYNLQAAYWYFAAVVHSTRLLPACYYNVHFVRDALRKFLVNLCISMHIFCICAGIYCKNY